MQDFGDSFDKNRLNNLNEFNYSWDDTEHEFLDIELDNKVTELWTAIDDFLGYLASNTRPNDAGFATVIPKDVDPDIEIPEYVREAYEL